MGVAQNKSWGYAGFGLYFHPRAPNMGSTFLSRSHMAVNLFEGSVTEPRRTFVTDLVTDLCNKTRLARYTPLVTHPRYTPSSHAIVTRPRYTPQMNKPGQ